MIFTETPVEGAYVVGPERHEDERGWFARTWCAREFSEHGLAATLSQCSLSFNLRSGTLRGLHYQAPPHEEAKLVRCPQGRIYDVVLDLRPHSSTFLTHFGVELDGADHRALYVPEGCAHGFQTLEDNSLVFYQMSAAYAPHAGRGVRWNDPAFGIDWPLPDPVIVDRDASYPDFRPESS